MSVSKLPLALSAVMLLGVMPAYAEDAPSAQPAKQEEKATSNVKAKPAEPAPPKMPKTIKNPEAGNPVQEWIAAENKLIDTLSAKDQKTFYIMRNKYGVIRSVRIVERDVKNAVKECGKANPDIKSTMDGRFKEWQDAVLPTIDLAEKFFNEEVDAQKVVFPSDFRHVLKLNDKAYEYGESKVEKQPVSSKEACQGLLDSMDRTENKMVELLQDILLPESVIRERAARAEEAEEAAKAKKASE